MGSSPILCIMWIIKKLISKGDYWYAKVPDHPNSTSNGYVLHHRIVMENHLNRLLTQDEIVHHINEIKKDNRVENLQVMSRSEHGKLHAPERKKLVHGTLTAFRYCKCILCKKAMSKYSRIYMKKHNNIKVKSSNPCVICGKFFKTRPSRINQKTCSRSCGGKFRSMTNF